MARIHLVACVKTKEDKPCKARDLYKSDLFIKAKAYAEGNSGRWYILSAKYGLVDPDTVIEPYENTLNAMSSAQRAQWSDRVFEQLQPMLSAGDIVTFLAGKSYRDGLIPKLESLGVTVDIPMESLGIGEQLSWLKKHDAHAAKALVR